MDTPNLVSLIRLQEVTLNLVTLIWLHKVTINNGTQTQWLITVTTSDTLPQSILSS